ncbi:MAG: glutamate-5-semialdehyde dehydrogenase [Anaerolineae bacterium]
MASDTIEGPSTDDLQQMGARARVASRRLATSSLNARNGALHALAALLRFEGESVLQANAQDVDEARAAGLSAALLDRLMLNSARLESMAGGVEAVAALPDPLGETLDMRRLPNGLQLGRRRVPIGVVGVIYEARPNVTVDIAALCVKSGNAAILRGGKETSRSNAALTALIVCALEQAGLPGDCVQLLRSPERSLVTRLLQLDSFVDMIIPRGGAALHELCRREARMPVITGGIGVCHLYVDASADLAKSLPVIYNAKVQRPTVCNALDTVLVHRQIAASFLPRLAAELASAGVELRADPEAYAILAGPAAAQGWSLVPASDDDFGREFLSLVLSLRVVSGLDEALDHIARHSTGHSDGILTEDYTAAQRFIEEVDSAAVYVNASTRFTDGAEFGLGAEVAISTQKLHARGPMGLRELTTYKWVAYGSYHVRGS